MDRYLAQEFKSIKREFSMIEAMFSYQLDIDRGKTGTISGYSKLWGWSRNKVRRFVLGIRTDEGHMKDRKRTGEGQAIHFIDKALWGKEDSNGTVTGQVKDTKHDTTTNPNPNPNPKEEKKKTKKIDFSGYLQEKIIENNFIETKDKIFEFYLYRMNTKIKNKKQPYSSEYGINGLIKSLNGCRDAGLFVSECIDTAMESGWLKPDPEYFKNNNKKVNGNQQEDGGEQWLRMRKEARERGDIE